MGLFDMQIPAMLTDNESRELRQILQEAGFSHARTSRRGINTFFDHFRDKPARNKYSFRRQGWALSQWLLKCLRLELDVRGAAKTDGYCSDPRKFYYRCGI
jgi:hypothetical protein